MTLVFSLVGVGIAAVMARKAQRPRATFLRTTVTLTALSFVPDLTFGFDASSAEYRSLLEGNFVDYRLKFRGLVENPVELDLGALRALQPGSRDVRLPPIHLTTSPSVRQDAGQGRRRLDKRAATLAHGNARRGTVNITAELPTPSPTCAPLCHPLAEVMSRAGSVVLEATYGPDRAAMGGPVHRAHPLGGSVFHIGG